MVESRSRDNRGTELPYGVRDAPRAHLGSCPVHTLPAKYYTAPAHKALRRPEHADPQGRRRSGRLGQMLPGQERRSGGCSSGAEQRLAAQRGACFPSLVLTFGALVRCTLVDVIRGPGLPVGWLSSEHPAACARQTAVPVGAGWLRSCSQPSPLAFDSLGAGQMAASILNHLIMGLLACPLVSHPSDLACGRAVRPAMYCVPLPGLFEGVAASCGFFRLTCCN